MSPQAIFVILPLLWLLCGALLMQLGCAIVRVRAPNFLPAFVGMLLVGLVGVLATGAVYLIATVAVWVMEQQNPEAMTVLLTLLMGVPVNMFVFAGLYTNLLEGVTFGKGLAIAGVQVIGVGMFSIALAFIVGVYFLTQAG